MVSPSPDPSAAAVPDVGASDYLRTVLVQVHQDPAGSVALTVAIPAGVVQGRAVHPAVWLRRMAAEVRSRPGPEAGKENVARIFETHADRRDDLELKADALLASINHIYLVDATVTADGTPVPGRPGTLWQVRLDDVAAWTIGDPTATV